MQSELTPARPAQQRRWLARRLADVDPGGLALKTVRIGLFYAGLLFVWWLVVELEVWSPYVLPSPERVWESFQHYWDNGLLREAIQKSMTRLVIGYSISVAVGMIIGMACGANKYIDETVGGLVLGLQSLPSVTWLPLSLIWFGLNEKAIIFVVFMGSVFAVAISARTGFRSMPPLYKRAGQTMGANRLQMLRYVTLPAMMPGLSQGLKLGWSFAWRSLMAAEVVNATGVLSLGQLLEFGRSLNDMPLVVMVMVVIVVVGLAVDRLVFARLESWVQERWGLQHA